uniref:Uncharacterized protein n=1 Tax=Cannabis sativa TaxID=3483 RepID=A0A803R5Z1_CANSA
MKSAKEKVSDMASSAKEHVTTYKAKAQEKRKLQQEQRRRRRWQRSVEKQKRLKPRWNYMRPKGDMQLRSSTTNTTSYIKIHPLLAPPPLPPLPIPSMAMATATATATMPTPSLALLTPLIPLELTCQGTSICRSFQFIIYKIYMQYLVFVLLNWVVFIFFLYCI